MINKNARRTGISRRHFLASTGAAAGAAIAFPTIIPASALGRDNQVAPSNRIVLGVVGWGMQGPGNTDSFLAEKDCQVVAACDLDKDHLKEAEDKINKHYDNKDCKTYHDYRELMARTDIDAVMLAIPDHWHALVATEAARNKKDIYGEKPLARTIAEQQAIVKAVHANGRIWQTGSWQRSTGNFHKAAEIVRNGMIGKVAFCEVGLPAGHNDFAGTTKDRTPSDPPPELDYETWIGPSKMMPYIKCRVHRNWRWNYNTGGGQLLDWIGHHCDIAHWGLDFDLSGPSEIEGHGEFPAKDAIWNTCTKYFIKLKYPDNVEMTIAGGYPDIRSGTTWIGSEGWVYVDRGKFDASNKDWNDFKKLPEEMRKVKLYESTNHQRNFLDCVKSRKPTITPVDVAHHSAIPGHLGLISMMTGKKIKWDVASEQILDHKGLPAAEQYTNGVESKHRGPGKDIETERALLTRTYRAPWQFPV